MNQKFLTEQAIILAAGESSRFWPLNNQHKSLVKIMGSPLIFWTIESLKRAGIKDIIVVQGPERDVEKELKNYKVSEIKYVVQRKPRSTGDALWQAKKLIKGPFVVLGAHKIDLDNYLSFLLGKFKKNQNKAILLGVRTFRPWDFGIAQFKGNKITKIIENPQKEKEPSNIKIAETYVFPAEFFEYYKRVYQREENLIDAINLLTREKGAELVLSKEEPVSLKYPWDLFYTLKKSFESKNLKNYISPSAKIRKNAVINGKVYIGKNVIIGENTVISGPCYIGDNCQIGAGNILRGPVDLEENVKTGSFCEIKNTIIQEGTHLHSGYFGDSIIGANCRFGAGFISANRRIDRNNINSLVKGKKTDTGLIYFGVVVGERSRLGIHSGVMPGVFIGSDCLVGPHSVVMENIPDNTIYYAKFQKIIKKRIGENKD